MDEKAFEALSTDVDKWIEEGILEDETKYDLTAVHLSGVNQLEQLFERGMHCTACVYEKGATVFEGVDFGPALEGQHAVMRSLMEIAEAPPAPADVAGAVERVGDQILSLYQTIDTVAPVAASPVMTSTWAMSQMTHNLSGVPVFASMLPNWQVPTADVLRLLQLLYEELQEAANVAGGQFGAGARVMLARLAQLMRTLRAAGPQVNLAAVMAAIRQILPRLLELLRGSLTPARFRLVLQAVLRFTVGLAELIPGAAGAGGAVAGGGGASGGAAAGLGTAAWYVLLILAAFGLGCLIGWAIGQIKIGDKTIHEWLGDCFYWLFWAPPAACKPIWNMYVAMGNRAREARNAGDKLSEKTALTAQINLLQRYIALACEDNMDIYRRQVERLQRQLSQL